MFSNKPKPKSQGSTITEIAEVWEKTGKMWLDVIVEGIQDNHFTVLEQISGKKPPSISSKAKRQALTRVKLLQYSAYLQRMERAKYIPLSEGREFSTVLALQHFKDDYDWCMQNLDRYLSLGGEDKCNRFLGDILEQLLPDANKYHAERMIHLATLNEFMMTEMLLLDAAVIVAIAFDDQEAVREFRQRLKTIRDHNSNKIKE